MTNKTDAPLTTSTGHSMSEASYLDSHYLACQPEYEAMLKSAGLQPGWHVLDAGCGSGSFLPLMSQLLGRTGRIDALDLAPENVAHVEDIRSQNIYDCPVTTQVGSVTELPYEDDTFDAVWCANTTQYLNDEELTTSLLEFYRVVKPGGVVAIKDIDITTISFWPLGSHLFSHLYEAEAKAGHSRTLQMFRDNELFAWLKRAGFVNVKFKTTLVERFHPLPPANESFLKVVFQSIYERVQNCDLPSKDLAIWERFAEIDSPQSALNDENFYFREGHILVVSTVPE